MIYDETEKHFDKKPTMSRCHTLEPEVPAKIWKSKKCCCFLYPFVTSKKTLIDFWKTFKRSYLQNGDELEAHTWPLFFNGLNLPLVGILDQNIR